MLTVLDDVGRRRPFIVMGTLAVSCALLVLGWTKEIVGVFFNPQSDFVSLSWCVTWGEN